MSLRARLALLYTSIMGGILFIFGTVVYISVSVTLTNDINRTLAWSAYQVYDGITADMFGVSFAELDQFVDVYIQVWGRNGQLVARTENISSYTAPLDEANFQSLLPVYNEVTISNARLRVLTVPLVIRNSRRVVGVVQVGSSLEKVEKTQSVLLWVLFVGSALSMAIAGVAGWFSTNQVLTPVEAVTQTALQITRADDLSRRIQYHGPPDDEVGQLIRAFNQTLSRLENLFNTQRRFLVDVGHELRTPLTVIKGNIDLMRRMDCTDDESMESIDNEVSRLTRLVGDLLLLAQAESGKLPLVKGMVEVDSLVLEVLSQMRVLVKDRMQLKLGDFDQVLICGDQDRLKQVLVNLIGNAINYTPGGGEVVVGLGKLENRARITISDNGPGIPAEDLPHIFERFYRGEKSRTRSRDGKGFGLGLSIAYWIVRNHDGQIEVSSKEGQGTTFCIWLPLAEEGCQEPKA